MSLTDKLNSTVIVFRDKIESVRQGRTQTANRVTSDSRKTPVEDSDVVIFLMDAENCQIEPELALETVRSKFGKVWIKKAYSQWSANPSRSVPFKQFRAAGFECVTCDTGNNNADIMLSVDAMDLMWEYSLKGMIGTLVIAADGDRGFAHIFDRATKRGWSTMLLAKEDSIGANPILYSAAETVLHPKNLHAEKEVQIPEIDTNTENVIIKKQEETIITSPDTNNPIKGFSTAMRPTFKFPKDPQDTARILLHFNKLRDSNRIWDDAYLEELKAEYGIPKSRANSVIIRASRVLEMMLKNHELNWNKIPNIQVIILKLKDYIISIIPTYDAIDDDSAPQIKIYFNKVAEFIRNVEIQHKDGTPSKSIPGFNTTLRPGKPSIRFPKEPYDVAILINTFQSFRDNKITWNDAILSIREKSDLSQTRFNNTIPKIRVAINITNNNADIDWNTIPSSTKLVDLIQQIILSKVDDHKTLTSASISDIKEYFTEVNSYFC